MILYGSSGVGEPKYAGGVAAGQEGGEYTGLGLTMLRPSTELVLTEQVEPEPVELAIEYDPEGRVREELIPVWALGAAAIAAAVWWWGAR